MADTSRDMRIALVAALGGFLLGFDATVISGAVPLIGAYFGIQGAAHSLKLGWTVSCLDWGAMAGNLVAGPLADRLGRRTVLRLTAAVFFASSLLAADAHTFLVLILARVLGGLAVGAAILVAPMYVTEIAPADRRGRLVATNQLMIVLGICVSFLSNDLLLGLGAGSWRAMLGVEAIPALVFLALLLAVPESPRWLLARGRRPPALAALRAVHGEAAAGEFERIAPAAPAEPLGSWRRLWAARLRFALIFAAGLAFFQQATGINAVLYYLPTILARAGGGLANAFRQSVLVGLINVGMTLVAMSLIDRVGRKPLLLAGGTGMAAALLAIAWAFRVGPAGAPVAHPALVLAGIVTFVASFAVSFGPVTWVMVAEIFPDRERAVALSAVCFWNSLISAGVTLMFTWELAHWGAAGTFLGYGLLALAALVFIAVAGPETRGKTLEDIAQLLSGRGVRQRAPAPADLEAGQPAAPRPPA
ncbi:MAG: sugar porter family MFS transporter [Steroidobacteraceae bacterium]